MSFAIRNDRKGWRAVNGPDDVGPDEVFSEGQPAEIVPDLVIQYQSAVQAKLDAEAKAKGYDDIVSACSYAAAPNIFQAEAQAFLAWRANCWAHCYQAMAAVQSGQRPQPTVAELLAELPALVLP